MKFFSVLTAVLTAAVLSVTAIIAPASSAAAVGFKDASLPAAELEASSSSVSDYTIMVYMCGSDLESRYGYAKSDLNEIINGYTGKNVNIIVQTGGCSSWKYKNIPSDQCCRYQVTKSGLRLIDDSIGKLDMGNKNTLGNFIKYCKNRYTAKHYGLVLWDHGGGSLYGFGSDENFDGSDLDLTELNFALRRGGVKFDFIGFDACLMATVETAISIADYSPYLFAAEEIEPGIGWYYTPWVNALCRNPNLSAEKIGRTIADSSIREVLRHDKNAVTNISIIDTAKVVSKVIPRLNNFAAKGIELLKDEKFSQVATARWDSDLYSSGYNMVDIFKLCDNVSSLSGMKVPGNSIKEAVSSCIIYNRKSDSSLDLCGLSIAFPFDDITTLDLLVNIYKQSGHPSTYTSFLTYFANIMAGGQYYSSQDGRSDYTDCKWYNKSQFYSKDYYCRNFLTEDDLQLKKSGNDIYISFPYEKSEFLTDVYVDLDIYDANSRRLISYGYDNTFFSVDVSKDESEMLIYLDYDFRWAALNGKLVPIYYDYTEYGDDGYRASVSRVPCYYNDVEADVFLLWDNDTCKDGCAFAWAPIDANGKTSRTFDIEEGDVINPIYTIYDYKTKKNTTQNILKNNTIVVGKKGLKVSYEDVPSTDDTAPVAYIILRDVFNNVYYSSDVVYFSHEPQLL